MNTLTEYASMMAKATAKSQYAGYWDWFIAEAKPFDKRTPTRQHAKYLRDWKRKHRPKAKECYYNNQLLTVLQPAETDLRYYEGLVSGIIPVEHAWTVNNATGLIVDQTLETADNMCKKLGIARHKDETYLGIEIPVGFIRSAIDNGVAATSLLFSWYLEKQQQKLQSTCTSSIRDV